LYQYCSKDDYNAFYKKQDSVHEQETVWSKWQKYLAGARDIACLYYLLYSDKNGILTIEKPTFEKKVYDAFQELYLYEHLVDPRNKCNSYGKLFTKKLTDTILEGLPPEAFRWDKYSNEIEETLLKQIKHILDTKKINLNKEPFNLQCFPQSVITAVTSGLRIYFNLPDGCNLTFATDKVISSILLRIRDESVDAGDEFEDRVIECEVAYVNTNDPVTNESNKVEHDAPGESEQGLLSLMERNILQETDDAGECLPKTPSAPSAVRNSGDHTATKTTTMAAQAIVFLSNNLPGNRGGGENENTLDAENITELEEQTKRCQDDTARASNQFPAMAAQAMVSLSNNLRVNRDSEEDKDTSKEWNQLPAALASPHPDAENNSTEFEAEEQTPPTVNATDLCQENTATVSIQFPDELNSAVTGLAILYQINSELFARIAVEIKEGIKDTPKIDVTTSERDTYPNRPEISSQLCCADLFCMMENDHEIACSTECPVCRQLCHEECTRHDSRYNNNVCIQCLCTSKNKKSKK